MPLFSDFYIPRSVKSAYDWEMYPKSAYMIFSEGIGFELLVAWRKNRAQTLLWCLSFITINKKFNKSMNDSLKYNCNFLQEKSVFLTGIYEYYTCHWY